MSRNYHKSIVFTRTPIKEKFRYKDVFQFYPMNIEGAPTHENATHFPVIFEYWTDEKDVLKSFKEEFRVFALMGSRVNKLRRITNLISSVSNFYFFQYTDSELGWSVPFPEVTDNLDEINQSKSSPSIKGYYFPEWNTELNISAFSKVDFEEVRLCSHKSYFIFDPIEYPEKPISFTDKIHDILDCYFYLDVKKQTVIDSMAYQICSSLELRRKMKSLSFFSAVSAIETLIHFEYKKHKVEFECGSCKTIKSSGYNCKECGRPIWGLTAQFREFLSKYVSPSDDSIKKYSKIYNIRSKIAHTQYLLTGDGMLDFAFDDKTEELNMLQVEAIQLSRLSISNWLLMHGTTSNC